ncbi:chloride channel protein [Alloyangia pacifica]|uniref:Chloride channel protein, CIC family n=1 Tax=Alloyangia pacifica TaxID=311180 RepID=A0A1I6UUT6_9RHOB|nr:chloride channel protein [Alloyangia pacifica]SDI53927.1 chloride channel protein, CIC family [Alloyangia pacifica]SFT05156.1 chloride channel protein, CIC family [Alloyangia pacifica]
MLRRPRTKLRAALGRLHAPSRFRIFVRRNEIAYTLIAAAVGAVAASSVVAMQEALHLLSHLVFGQPGAISATQGLAPLRAFAGPAAGGIVLGLSWFVGRRWFRHIADPIEANAVRGGRIGLPGSLFITGQTIASSGFGASVGMEAAYTQASGAIASLLGQALRLRREDLRQLVAAGAGGAIAAAFDAPLTGAFYAFELVLATYSVSALLPILAASITATSVARALVGPHGENLHYAGDIPVHSYLPILVLSVVAAGIGIALMRSVTLIEQAFRKSPLPPWLQPMLGGALVGAMAIASPRILSSGHGAMGVVLSKDLALPMLAMIFVLKCAASAISIGSGFRGGLFFASLLLGALLGKIFGILWMLGPGLDLPIVVLAVIGMSAFATTVIGAPLAVSFLALETTMSLPLALAVLFSALIATAITRNFFGYSFSTWRFHLRGETIRSAADVGWIRDLSVGKMMRRSTSEIPDTMRISEARRRFPLGATKAFPLSDTECRYSGICLTAELHSDELEDTEPVSSIARFRNAWLTPELNVREAISAFARHEADSLAVLGPGDSVLGVLNEQYCLRRYAEETNKRLYPSRS